MSARARILGWVLLVVLLALAGTLLATRAVLRDQLDGRLDTEISHESSKLRAYLASADSREPTVDALLRRYLERNLPEKYETFFSIVDGAAAQRSAVEPPARLDTDRALVAELAAVSSPRYGTVETAVGSARYGCGSETPR